MPAQQLPAIPAAKPKSQPKRRGRGRFVAVLVAVGLFAALLVTSAYFYGASRDADTHARKAATSTARSQLAKLTHGAVTMEDNDYPDAWRKGKINWTFGVGTCHLVEGYLKMAKRPAPNGAEVHILVVGKNPQARPADLPLASEDDFTRFKQTVTGDDSGLAHCTVGDGRLQHTSS